MANEQNLKPWPKGKSGNPAGRPKGSVDVMVLAQRLLENPEELPAKLAAAIRKRFGKDRTALEALLLAGIDSGITGDMKATKEILDRAYGKVGDTVDLNHKTDPDAPPVFTLKIDNS